jgi:DNA-binding transcriptional regulator YiaG
MNHPHRSARWQMTPDQLLAAIDTMTGGNQSAFARLIGVDGRTVRYWITGEQRIPKPIQILITALLRLSAAEREAL